MKTSITVTSKGQVTLPAKIRRQLGVAQGGILEVDFHEVSKRMVVTRPVSFEELRKESARYLKPGTKPLVEVEGFFNTREPRL